jgi:hypothetical protein
MSEARTILFQLMGEGSAARGHFQIWWALRHLAIPKYLPTMDDSSYVDFFLASNAGHFNLFFLALSKIFDRDSRVAGISNLKEALCNEGHSQLAHNFEKSIEPLHPLVARVMTIRNKTIVHNDRELPREKVYDLNGVSPNEIRSLIDSTCTAINKVAHGLGITNIIFDDDRLERATLAMLERLAREP